MCGASKIWNLSSYISEQFFFQTFVDYY